MLSLLLLAAAVLAVYLGFRFSRQKAPAPPSTYEEKPEELNRKATAAYEPKIDARPGTSKPLHAGQAKLVFKRLQQSTEPGPHAMTDLKDYQCPFLNLLGQVPAEWIFENEGELEKHKDQIVQTLKGFGIEIASIAATISPAVTLYEIIPARGVHVADIRRLEMELSLGLAAPSLRMIAPNPGKGSIGIEVPNATKRLVSMREVLGVEAFQDVKYDLPIAMGKTNDDKTFLFDLATAPHLLITGTTGQGKSVALHGILLSLLFKKRPSELKLMLIDLKKIELNAYAILEKHFLAGIKDGNPIITDPRDAVRSLNALCIELDNRYDLMRSANVHDINEYNDKASQRQPSPNQDNQFLPFIVVAIDDIIELIMMCGEEAKVPIIRLAAEGRQAGIHMILVTSGHPTASQSHGLFQNIPARGSFRLGSRDDSKTILNMAGAEKLNHPGDMLLSMNNQTVHIACAFVKSVEIDAVTQFIAAQKGYPDIYPLPERILENELEANCFDLGDRDPLLEEAAHLIVTHQLGSTALIQRKMKLGYNRAARLMDQLEAIGIVGHGKGSQPRDVLIRSEKELDQYLRG